MIKKLIVALITIVFFSISVLAKDKKPESRSNYWLITCLENIDKNSSVDTKNKNNISSKKESERWDRKKVIFQTCLLYGLMTPPRLPEILPNLKGSTFKRYLKSIKINNWQWRDGNRNATNYWIPRNLKDYFVGHGPMGVLIEEIFAQNDPYSLSAPIFSKKYFKAKFFRQWPYAVNGALGFEFGIFFLPININGKTILLPLLNPFNESLLGHVGSNGRDRHGFVDIFGGTSSFATLLSMYFDAMDKWVVQPIFFYKFRYDHWYIKYPMTIAGCLIVFPKSIARILDFKAPHNRNYKWPDLR